MIELGAAAVAGLALGLRWRRSYAAHTRRIDSLDLRVHVNGIRGKSSVTRLVAGILREGGYVTVAKTTGSAARVIGPLGEETAIHRRGAASIVEQLAVVARHVRPGVDALVVECMAVNPRYQAAAQEQIVRGDITIITNVREDHQEQMGETLAEIADSLSATIPIDGIVITAEDRPELRDRLAVNASARGATLIVADESTVHDDDMRGFDHVEFRANVAIGLTVARHLGIDREVAIRGMWKAVPDVGALRLASVDIAGRDVLWVPLFAANDRESVVRVLDEIAGPWLGGRTVIGILNNRWDRGRRAEQFASMVPTDLARHLDYVITFGAYEGQVTRQMVELGYPRERITNLGESVDPSLDQILEAIGGLVGDRKGALVGLANIHTPQAELLLEHFARATSTHLDEIGQSRLPARWPSVARRRQAQAAHLLAHG